MTRPEARRAARWVSSLAGVVLLGSLMACDDPLGLEAGEREVRMEVAADRAPCVGVAPQTCLQVRQPGSGAPWSLFYAPIEGFTHASGFTYVLRVARRQIRNPPADGSAYAYRLLEIVSRTPAP